LIVCWWTTIGAPTAPITAFELARLSTAILAKLATGANLARRGSCEQFAQDDVQDLGRVAQAKHVERQAEEVQPPAESSSRCSCRRPFELHREQRVRLRELRLDRPSTSDWLIASPL